MKRIHYILAATLCLTLASCQTEEPRVGNPDPMVQLAAPNLNDNQNISRSSMFVFMDNDVTTDTLWFDIIVVAAIPDRTMYLKLEAFDEIVYEYVYDEKGALIDSIGTKVPNQAVAGRHYVAFDDPEYSKLLKIEAGKYTGRIPVVTLRHESLKDNVYYLNFRVVDSEELKVSGPKGRSVQIAISDKVSRPSEWNANFYLFGAYGEAKHGFMIRETGQKWDDEFISMIRTSQTDVIYYRQMLRAALEEYNAERASQNPPLPPLAEEDGTVVEFPAS